MAKEITLCGGPMDGQAFTVENHIQVFTIQEPIEVLSKDPNTHSITYREHRYTEFQPACLYFCYQEE
jgi:hypothetical protein